MDPGGPESQGQYLASGNSRSTETSVSLSDMGQIKMQMQFQLRSLQRIVAELKNSLTQDRMRYDELFRHVSASKESLKSTEFRLTNLQKFVATQADSANTTKKQVADNYNESKTLATAIELELDQLRGQIETMNRSIQELPAVRGGAAAATALPGNVLQLFDALDRQMSVYDTRLAEMDVRFQVIESTSYNGVLIWKITDFLRRKDDARKGKTLSIYSQPFYTSRYGYKMCLRVYLNGDGMGKNTHISLFFVLMRGEYDALLQFPFRQKVTLMLLDQSNNRRHLTDVFRPDPSSSSFRRPQTDMNIASGCPMFVAHDVVLDSSYSKEDTIFIKCVIDTGDLN